MLDYNRFHLKNKKTQVKLISKSDYTYQTMIFLASIFFIKRRGKILDLGCGVGTIDFFLANQGFSVTGIDISKRAISLANKSRRALNIRNVNFLQADVQAYACEEKYDYVICSEVLEHLTDTTDVVGYIYDCLKINGICVISVPSVNAPLYKLGFLEEFDKEVGHLRRYSEVLLRKSFKNSKFKLLKTIRTEGILRNLLYTNKKMGFLIHFIRPPINLLVNLADNLLMNLFGESNIYMVFRKV